MPNYREEKPGTGTSLQEQFAPHHKTHDELVAAFRAHVNAKQQAYRKGVRQDISPEEILGIELYHQRHEAPLNSAQEAFFEPLVYAWEILIYDRLPRVSQYAANNLIAEAYHKHHTLKLNDTQVRMLDAMAEAVGISHPRGQSEIPVPERQFYYRYGHNPAGATDPTTKT